MYDEVLVAMSQHRAKAFLMTIPMLLALGGCEIPTSAKIGNGPAFSFRGSGRLASFRIYGPQPDHRIATPFDEKSLVWRVQPLEGYFKGAQVQWLEVKAGSEPRGYAQTTPSRGAVPTRPQGRVYYFFPATRDAPPTRGFSYL